MGRRHIAIGSVGALLLTILGALFPPAANAANNPLIEASLSGFIRITQLGVPITDPGQMYVGDYLEMTVDFDASNADPVPGDSFMVELPSELSNIEFGRPGNEIIKPLMFGDVQVGDCVIEQRKFTCTFNNSIVGKENVKGTVTARVSAVAASTSPDVVLNLNGVETVVTIPGGSGIAVRQTSFTASNRLSKGATGLGINSRAVNWNLNVGGAWLVNNLPGQSSFTIVDTLPNTLLTGTTTLSSIVLLRSTPETNGVMRQVARANGDVLVEGYKLEYSADPDGLTYRFKVTTPQEFTTQENYQIFFLTPTTDGQTIDRGWVYTNQFRIEGVNAVTRGEKFYVESFGANVSYDEGFGAFQITKKATGAGEISTGQQFDVLVSYTLPDGFQAPAGWTAPPNPFRATLTLGTPTLITPQLPAGTRVSVVEDLDVANSTAADGVTWTNPTFSPFNSADASKFSITEGGSKVDFTIERETSLRLELTNKSVTQSTFQVAKTVAGDDAAAYQDQTFDFTYTCTDGQSGTVTGVPGDGTPVRITDKAFPVDTVCTVSEVDPPTRDGYSLTKATDTQVTVMNAVQTATMVNTYRRDSGNFEITKVLNANGSRGFETFDVEYECSADGYGPDADGTVVPARGTAAVTAGETTLVGRFPLGTTCQITGEEPQEREGYDFSSQFGGAVTIDEDGEAATITNTYVPQMGTFSVEKKVIGNGSTGASGEQFEIAYTCTPLLRTGLPPVSGTVQVAEGASARVGEFQVGTKCVVTGETGAEREGYTLSQDLGSEVTIAKDTDTKITVTNTYTRDLAPFTISKTVVANGSAGSDEFTVSYECSAAGADGVAAAGEVRVRAGESTLVGQFPTGTTCQVTAEPGVEPRDGYTLTTDLGAEVTIAKNDGAQVSVTNTYARDYAQLRITKTVVANGSTGSGSFTATYECDAEGRNASGDTVPATGKVELTDGNATVVGEFPTGTTCSVTGEEGAEREGYTLAKDLGQAITLTKEQAPDTGITVTNTYTRQYGDFSIAKTVNAGGSTGSDTFTVDYVCTAAGDGVAAEGSVQVTAGRTTRVGSFPTGTSCRVSGEDRDSADRAGYTLGVDLGVPVTIVNSGGQAAEVTNTYVRQRGGFVINKTVAGDGAALAPNAVQFTYDCADADPVTVTVTPGVPFEVTDVATGACTLTEGDAGAALTDLDTTIAIDGQTSADGSFTVTDQTTTEIEVTNTYTLHRGTFEVTKQISPEALSDREFRFNYTCGDVTGTLQVPGDGTAVPGPQIPLGTSCTIAEDGASAQVEDYALTPPDPQTVTVDSATQPVRAAFVNEYRRHTAGFSISKRVEGGPFTADEFTFAYACGDVSGTVQVPGGGTAVSAGVDLPTGTSCRVWEDTDSAQRAGYALTAPQQQTITLTGDGSNTVIEFVNEYTANEPTSTPSPTPGDDTPTPSITPRPDRPGLPKTGD